jgi:hypothetical protein
VHLGAVVRGPAHGLGLDQAGRLEPRHRAARQLDTRAAGRVDGDDVRGRHRATSHTRDARADPREPTVHTARQLAHVAARDIEHAQPSEPLLVAAERDLTPVG